MGLWRIWQGQGKIFSGSKKGDEKNGFSHLLYAS